MPEWSDEQRESVAAQFRRVGGDWHESSGLSDPRGVLWFECLACHRMRTIELVTNAAPDGDGGVRWRCRKCGWSGTPGGALRVPEWSTAQSHRDARLPGYRARGAGEVRPPALPHLQRPARRHCRGRKRRPPRGPCSRSLRRVRGLVPSGGMSRAPIPGCGCHACSFSHSTDSGWPFHAGQRLTATCLASDSSPGE